MNTDSDFIPEDSETDSEIETQSNIDAPIISEDDSFIDTLDEIDAIDVINTIYELFEEYHDTYILLTSTPKFYPDMVQTISEIIYQDLIILRFNYLKKEVSFDPIYEYPDEDVCLFKEFPHERLVFPLIVYKLLM